MIISEKQWRLAFFILLTIVLTSIIVMAILFHYYFPPVSEEESFTYQDEIKKVENVFTVHTNRSNLNYFIQEHQTGEYKIKFNPENIVFETEVPIFSREVVAEILMNPELMDNGDLLLHSDSMRIGRFPLPEATILQFIMNNIELPEWAIIYPLQEQVHIKMDKIKVADDLQIYFTEFDLEKDSIIMDVSITK